MSLRDRLRRVGVFLRELDAEVTELHERQRLCHRPWEEEFLHWAYDGRTWHLHGHLTPPDDGRHRSVTRSGWCPGLRHTGGSSPISP